MSISLSNIQAAELANLPVSTPSSLGAIIVGSGLSIAGGILSASGGGGSSPTYGSYSSLTISGSGTNVLTSSGQLNSATLLITGGAGSYSSNLILSNSGAVADAVYLVNLTLPPTTYPHVNIYSSGVAGTLLETISGNGTFGSTTLTFTYNGSSWLPYKKGALLQYQNLADIQNAATARTNLGLGTLATANTSSDGFIFVQGGAVQDSWSIGPAPSTTATTVTISGGTNTSPTNNSQAGAAILQGGFTLGNGIACIGGAAIVSGGNAPFEIGSGGNVYIDGGTGQNNSNNGSIFIGQTNSLSTNISCNSGGAINIIAGATQNVNGANVFIEAGSNSYASGPYAGNLYLYGGTASGPSYFMVAGSVIIGGGNAFPNGICSPGTVTIDGGYLIGNTWANGAVNLGVNSNNINIGTSGGYFINVGNSSCNTFQVYSENILLNPVYNGAIVQVGGQGNTTNISSSAVTIGANYSNSITIGTTLGGYSISPILIQGQNQATLVTGYVGEVISKKVKAASGVSLVNNTAKNVAQIVLTAGDWDVEANINYSGAAATVTQYKGCITTTSGVLNTDGTEVYSDAQLTTTTAVNSVIIPTYPINVTTTVTGFLVGYCSFSAGSVSAFGSITARRRT